MDNLLLQVGPCTLLLPDDMESRGHVEGKKLRELWLSHGYDSSNSSSQDCAVRYCKKSLFKKTAGEATAMLTKLVGVETHKTNCAEVSRAFGCTCEDFDLPQDMARLILTFLRYAVHVMCCYSTHLLGRASFRIELLGASGPPHRHAS